MLDFFQHQDRARRNTKWLIAYFVVAVVLIILAVYLVLGGAVYFYEHDKNPNAAWFHPELFAVVTCATLLIVAMGSLFKIATLSSGGETVAESLGGRPVLPNTTDLAERILLNVVEEMALASGTPVPPVYIMEGERGINAFAAGTTPQNAVIGVTRGAIETLKRDELQGVIAHEFSHILNGDMRLNLRLIGLLHGILLISMIGWILMRTGSRSSYFSSSNDKKGGNPLPLIGLALYIIGYVGVFFGHLIKSAVSRQREFLADASAVQFTRYPEGICGALKKIGGLVQGSRIESSHAEEASHMFFGNGLRESLFSWLATHPPLPVRISRLDSGFNGQYPQTSRVTHSLSELIDPRTLSQLRSSGQVVHSAAVAGAQSFAAEPQTVTDQVGEPEQAHMDYASLVVQSLPDDLANNVHDPLGAIGVIYALLLSRDEAVRRRQFEHLSQHADPRAYQQLLPLVKSAATAPSEAKLPLVSMALPALHELSPRQLESFRKDVVELIRADERVTLFEYAVHRLVLKRLLPRLEGQRPAVVKYMTLSPLVSSLSGLLSTLAHAGGNENRSIDAFRSAAIELFGPEGSRIELLPREQCGLKVIDAALDQLVAASPAIKRRVIEACALCIGVDQRVSIEEAELLRVISDALDCPMPPLVGKPV
jgi:Zn-dependent protease with chaperone function